MKTSYYETVIEAPSELHEILIALMADEGYEAFEEENHRLTAYVQASLLQKEQVRAILEPFSERITSIQHRLLPLKNWNEVWESNYQSVEIGNFCQVVPTHRQVKDNFTHTIHLDPKMAFGTGHHHTTRLMVLQMEHLSIDGKSVLDMGCGTGILAILAKKMGASDVSAIDIDPWSEENCRENSKINGVSGMEIVLGDVTSIPNRHYEVILANINRNVLLKDIPAYANHLSSGGMLIISGFYTQDLNEILAVSEKSCLRREKLLEENNWLSLKLVKQAI
ncbi:MAG: 50S ribosomal protein L11 methyltransferase [Bacteroidia bacterium]|nr:50S ribosomal protein L11 methyltransferase [Bacteroidia bacterium]